MAVIPLLQYTMILRNRFDWDDGNSPDMLNQMGSTADHGKFERSQFAVLEKLGSGHYGTVILRCVLHKLS